MTTCGLVRVQEIDSDITAFLRDVEDLERELCANSVNQRELNDQDISDISCGGLVNHVGQRVVVERNFSCVVSGSCAGVSWEQLNGLNHVH